MLSPAGFEGPEGGFAFNKQLLDPTVYAVAPAWWFVSFVQIMAPLALVGLAISASLILSRWQKSFAVVGADMKPKAEALAHAQKRIRVLLYLGAIALVAGTLQSSALYTWAITMLDPGEYYSNSSDIPQAMGILNGAFYSIFLAGVFVPAIAHLRTQGLTLVEAILSDASAAERKKWLEDNAIEGTLPRQLLNALAVSAPLLAGGPLVSLLEGLAT